MAKQELQNMKEMTDKEREEFFKNLKDSLRNIEQPKPKGLLATGWLCPRCGAGCSPYVSQCSCIQTTYTFT